jgi:hypothetical protein
MAPARSISSLLSTMDIMRTLCLPLALAVFGGESLQIRAYGDEEKF